MPFFPEPRPDRYRSSKKSDHIAPHFRLEGHEPSSFRRSYSDVVAGRYRPQHNTQNHSQLTSVRNFWKHEERPVRDVSPTQPPRHAPKNVNMGPTKVNGRRREPVNTLATRPEHTSPHIHKKQDPNYKKFSTLVKRLFELIRAHHHHLKVSKDNNEEPSTFSRLTQYLAEVIKPAKMTPLTKSLLEGNAKNWAYTTKMILQDHYTQCINLQGETLQDLMVDDWESAFTIAIKWYQNRFKKRHMTEPIEKVREILTSLTDEPDEIPSPVEMITWQFEESSEAMETRALNRRVHSPPPGPEKPHPTHSSTPSPAPLPPRTPKKPKGSFAKQNPEKEKSVTKNTTPHVVMLHPERPNPELMAATDVDYLLSISEHDRERPRESFVEKHSEREKSVAQNTKNTITHVVMLHPEKPNPELMATTDVDSLICMSERDREKSPLPGPQLIPVTTPIQSPVVFKATKHLIPTKKMLDWSFKARKKWCWIGDSNLSRMPPHNLENLQIDSYPGATFRHAGAFISRAKKQTDVDTIVLAFGINHRAQKQRETAIKQLQRAVKRTKEQFPRAKIWIPLINYSENLKSNEKTGLAELNAHIKRNMPYLPLLPEKQFQVGPNQIHWTSTCAKAMLEHWCNHLGFEAQ